MAVGKRIVTVLEWAEHAKIIWEAVSFIFGFQIVKVALTHLTHIPGDIVTAIACGFGLVVIVVMHRFIHRTPQPKTGDSSPPQASGVVPGIPTLSALLGQNPSVVFDAKKFFALAYYSPLTAEIEKNIKLIAQQNFPNDKEAFYTRFIGIWFIAYQYDVSWFTIFGSQLRALEEMNSRGMIPLADLKKHYDAAAANNPKFYATYSFDQWVSFMKGRLLIAVYPSQMVELSWGGKDFLKYLAHMAWSATNKPN